MALITATSLEAAGQKKPAKRPKKPKTLQPKDERVPETRDPADAPAPVEPPKEPEPAPPPPRRESEPPRPPSRSTWLSRPLLVGVTAGYATENLRIGLGMRVAYSFFDDIYVGVGFTYQLGVAIRDVTYRGFYPALEGGYDWHIDAITIRPYAGVALYFAQVAGAGVSDTGSGYFSIYPGLHADYQIANTPGFVGVDARLLVIFAETDPNPSLGLFAAGGMRF